MKKGLKILIFLFISAGIFALIGWKLTENKKKIESSAAKAQVRNTTVMVSSTFPQLAEMKKDFDANGLSGRLKRWPLFQKQREE